MNIEILGFIAGGLTSIALLPQVIKAIRTRSTRDISLQWMEINILGQLMWIIYGIFINSVSLYVMSIVAFVMALILLVVKLCFDKATKPIKI